MKFHIVSLFYSVGWFVYFINRLLPFLKFICDNAYTYIYFTTS